MVDRSASMGRKIASNDYTLARIAADSVNHTILSLVTKSMKEPGGRVAHYFDIGVIGYGATSTGLEGVESALGGVLARHAIVGIPELAEHPVRIEEDQPGADLKASRRRSPIWVEPLSADGRPMCQAFERVGAHLYEWVSAAGPSANPPVVVNITDGGPATDEPFQGARLDEWQNRVRNISTDGGSVNIYTVIVDSESGGLTLRPTSPDDLIRPGWSIRAVDGLLSDVSIGTWSADSVFDISDEL